MTDFAALGLSDHSPFAILSRPRSEPKVHKTPAKRGPKPNKKAQMLSALMTDAERKEAAILRNNNAKFTSVYQAQKNTPAAQVNCTVRNATANINTETMAQSDKTAAICRGGL